MSRDSVSMAAVEHYEEMRRGIPAFLVKRFLVGLVLDWRNGLGINRKTRVEQCYSGISEGSEKSPFDHQAFRIILEVRGREERYLVRVTKER
jgi:hypothetical protein